MARKSTGRINVTVGRLGTPLATYEVAAGSTVADALAAAGIGANGDVRVDAKSAKVTDKVKHGQVVTVIEKVQGG